MIQRLMVAILMFAAAGDGHGNGFALEANSASRQGNAYAGGAALADDASTVYFNPAGLTRLRSEQWIIGGQAVHVRTHFSPDSASNLNPALGGGALTGSSDTGTLAPALIPSFYYAKPVSPKWSAGVALTVPFGLGLDYKDDWIGRYHASKGTLRSLNINPGVAWRINDRFSAGGGINLQYLSAVLGAKIDSGATCLGVMTQAVGAAAAPGACAAVDPQLVTTGNSAIDSESTMEGSDWSSGWNVGLLYEAEESRIGLTYRSAITHRLAGDVTYRYSAPFSTFLTATGTTLFRDNSLSSEMALPDSASLSLYHDVDPQWSLMADLTWMGWDRFVENTIHFSNGQPDFTLPHHWKNTRRYSMAINYQPYGRWLWRAGAAYVETPIQDDRLRTLFITDQSHRVLALGGGYQWSKGLFLDMALSRAFYRKTPIDNSDSAFGHTLKGGYYGGRVDTVGLQIRRDYGGNQ